MPGEDDLGTAFPTGVEKAVVRHDAASTIGVRRSRASERERNIASGEPSGFVKQQKRNVCLHNSPHDRSELRGGTRD